MHRTSPPLRMRWRRLFALLPLVLATCVKVRQEGEECTFNGDCADDLVCAAHRCRATCRTERDCTNNYHCRPYGGDTRNICVPPLAPPVCKSDDDCPAPLRCGPDQQCRTPCAADYDCRLVAYGAVCSAAGMCLAPMGDGGGTKDDASVVGSDATMVDEALRDGSTSGSDATDAGSPSVDVLVDGPLMDAASDRVTGMDSATDATATDVPRRDGTLSFPDLSPPFQPDLPAVRPAQRINMLSFGRGSVIVRREDGSIYGWGSSSGDGARQFNLGLGSGDDVVSVPARLTIFPSNASVIASSSAAHCALLVDGTVRCVGSNGSGELGTGTLSSGSYTGVVVPGVSGVSGLAAGPSTFCAIRVDGQVRCWGRADQVYPFVAPAPLTAFAGLIAREVAVGFEHACVRFDDGTVRCFGRSACLGTGAVTSGTVPYPYPGGPVAQVAGLTDAVRIWAGLYLTCALRRTGRVVCWGEDPVRLVHSTGATILTPIEVTAFGLNPLEIGLSPARACFIHDSDRRVSCWQAPAVGADAGTPTPVELPGIDHVAVLQAHDIGSVNSFSSSDTGMVFMLDDDGRLFAFGDNRGGMMGNGSTRAITTAQRVWVE